MYIFFVPVIFSYDEKIVTSCSRLYVGLQGLHHDIKGK